MGGKTMRGSPVRLAVGIAASLLVAVPALAQFQQPAKATTGGGGESAGGGIQHFSAPGVGMAVGTGAGGGVTARHGFLVGAAGRARDEEPPVVDPVPPDIRISTARDRCEATVNFPAVRVTDNRDRIPQVTVTLLTDPPQNLDPAGDQVDLPIGSYDVIIVARDRAGNQTRETYRVDVVDEAAPIFRAVPDPTPVGGEVEAQGPAGTPVAVDFECVDACDPDPVGSVAPRLARYPVGDTRLTATCTDAEGNQATEQVTIRVRDTTGPAAAAVPPPVEVECQSAQGATFQVPQVVWVDNGTPADQLAVSMILNPNGANQAFAPPPAQLQLPRGQHVLRFVAEDAAGNVSEQDVAVEVTDNGVPNVRVVAAPGQNGWTNAAGDVQVVLEVADGCAADNGALQLDLGPPPDRIERNGNRVTLHYSADGVYPLAIEVTDEDGNVTRENSIAFGIDRTPPQPIFRAPGQGAVDAADEDTWPIFAQAEVLPIDFGGEDAGDGPTAGVRQVTVVYDPDGAARTLASQTFDGNGNPPRGDRLVAGIGCDNPFVVVGGVQRRDGYCNDDGELDLRYLEPGTHEIEVVVTDFAGNLARGRARFITADLQGGVVRIIDRLT
ncbi:MAG: hypothetical protein R3F43_31500, partial [bacterium]